MKKTPFSHPRFFYRSNHLSLLLWLLSFAWLLLTVGSVCAQANLFWDQNGASTGTGGTGNWGTANAWRVGSDTGTLQTWDNSGSATANLGGTAGTITIDTSLSSGVTMASLNVLASGYTIRSASGARPLVVSGGVTLSDGVALTLTQASTDPTWSLGTITFGSGASLSLGGNATANNANRINLTTTSTITGGSISLAGTSTGPTGFVAYTATSSPSVQVTLNTDISNASATSATMLGANFSNTLTYGGVVSGTSSLQISGGQSGGSGTVVLAAGNTYTGGTYLNHTSTGVLRLGITNALPTGTTVFFNQSASDGTLSTGGTLDLAGFNQTVAGLVSPSGVRGVANTGGASTLTLGGSGSYVFDSGIGVPSSTANLTGANNNITVIKNGTGIQTFGSANSFTGGLYINSGTLRIVNVITALGALPASPTSAVFLRGGTLQVDTTASSLDSGANRGFEVGPTSGSGSVTIQVDGSNSFIIQGAIVDTPGGSGRVVKTGTGTLRLQTTAKTFTGGLSVLAGSVSFGIDDRLGAVPASPTPGSILLNGGGLIVTDNVTLNANRGIALGPDTGSGSGTIQVTGSYVLTYAGIIADNPGGSGRLIKTGTGTLRLQNSTNTFTGGLTVNGGLVSYSLEDRIGTAPATPTPASIILDGGGLRLTLNNMTINPNRGIALGPDGGTGTGTLSVEAGRTLTYNGIMADNGSGSGGLEKVDAGTLVLGGANTFTGGTTLTAGSLLVTNTTGSATGTGAVSTVVGTTLGGTGTIAPTASHSVIIGGTVSPGISGSAGTLKFTPASGNVTMQSTSSIVFELFGNGSSDKLDFTASGGGLIDFSAMSAGSISVLFAIGYTPAVGHVFDLLDWSNLSGLSTSQLNLSTAGFDPTWTWDTSLFTTHGTLSIVVVPEPSRMTLLIIAAAASLSRRRRA